MALPKPQVKPTMSKENINKLLRLSHKLLKKRIDINSIKIYHTKIYLSRKGDYKWWKLIKRK